MTLKGEEKFKAAFRMLSNQLRDLDFEGKWREFEKEKKNNLQFSFITVYSNMVKRLL